MLLQRLALVAPLCFSVGVKQPFLVEVRRCIEAADRTAPLVVKWAVDELASIWFLECLVREKSVLSVSMLLVPEVDLDCRRLEHVSVSLLSCFPVFLLYLCQQRLLNPLLSSIALAVGVSVCENVARF